MVLLRPVWRTCVVWLVVVAGLVVCRPGSAAVAGDGSWSWPLGEHQVVGGFDLPDTKYSAGHRGIDLPGRVGEPVRAVAAGRVTFAGSVAGVGVVTIDHGGERSTYQPVHADVDRGDAVRAGEAIGTLSAFGSHCATACLHLGRLQGDGGYLDPLDRLATASHVHLVDPDGRPPAPPVGPGGDGALRRPVGGPVTSAYGMRVHPITGVRKLHDGTDFGVPCGTPVHAAATGTVVARGATGAYGNRVVVRHGGGLETSYNHLSATSVGVGQRVTSATVVGRVGSTGLSTGCHLHFMAIKGDRPVDPMPLF